MWVQRGRCDCRRLGLAYLVESPAVLVLVITVAQFIAVGLLERFPVLQGRTPREDGIAQVDFLNEDVVFGGSEVAHLGLFLVHGPSYLGGDFAGRFEDGSVVPPGAGHDVVVVPFGTRGRLGSLW